MVLSRAVRRLAQQKHFLTPLCRQSRGIALLSSPSSPLLFSRATLLLPQQDTLRVLVPRRYFETEADFHTVADETLETIQDAIDEALESTPSIEYELTVASGVLTLHLPGKGTWVINKQTPNTQLWWSSPLSGPKRFEYDPKEEIWFSTKHGLDLGPFLVQELRHVYPEIEDFDLNV